MPTSYLPNLRARIKAMALQSVASLDSNIEIWDYPLMSAHMPYFSVHITRWQKPSDTLSYTTEEFLSIQRTIELHLVMAKFTSGYKGENLQLLDEYEELVIDYFSTRNWLTSDAYPGKPAYIPAVGTECSQGTGLRFIRMGALEDTIMIASSFTINVPIQIEKS